MPAINTNTIAIGMPTNQGMNCTACSTTCNELNSTDPTYVSQLGPRPNREKVRKQIRDYILNMLGAPIIKIELDEQNVDFCIDQALKIIEDYAGREFYSYYILRTVPGKSVYELPPDVGMVRHVSYKQEDDFGFQAHDLGGAIPIEYIYDGGAFSMLGGNFFSPNQPLWGNMGQFQLMKQNMTMFNRMSGQQGGFEFVNNTRNIKLYPCPYRVHRVSVQYIQKNKDWNSYEQMMGEGALSYAKEILGRIRSKYSNMPGPSGGSQLDGATLIQEAKEERDKWKEELIYKFGDVVLPITWG